MSNCSTPTSFTVVPTAGDASTATLPYLAEPLGRYVNAPTGALEGIERLVPPAEVAPAKTQL